MTKATLILVLAVLIAAIIAGGIAIGFAQTITLVAVASTVLIFYLLIRTSLA